MIFEHPASFRDPSGSVIKQNNGFYRIINNSYKENHDYFVKSGLYEALSKESLIVNFEDANLNTENKNIYKVIKPEQIPFISYPYEWCISQLKDAALLTLKIQKKPSIPARTNCITKLPLPGST